MTALVEVKDLKKSYTIKRNLLGRPVESFPAVRGLSFEVASGETLAVVGESGAGKSTVGRLLLRLIEPDSGSITVNGHDVRAMGFERLRQFRANMQMVFQDPFSSLDPKMSIGASIAEPMLVQRNIGRSEREEQVVDLLQRVGLSAGHYDRYPYELSGGQLQRVAIARAISTQPALIVCDEPVAALDVSIRAQVLNLLRDIQHERGISYVFISHDLSLVRLFAHRVAVMFAGRIVEMGEPEALFAEPKHPYTKALLSAIPDIAPSRRKLRSLTIATSENAPVSDMGCAYVERCPVAVAACRDERPPLRDVEGGKVACHLYAAEGEPARPLGASLDLERSL